MSKPHPPTCVCWNDPNWNCMVDVCSEFRTESRDKLCDNCDHKEECHGKACILKDCADLAARLETALGLLRDFLHNYEFGDDVDDRIRAFFATIDADTARE